MGVAIACIGVSPAMGTCLPLSNTPVGRLHVARDVELRGRRPVSGGGRAAHDGDLADPAAQSRLALERHRDVGLRPDGREDQLLLVPLGHRDDEVDRMGSIGLRTGSGTCAPSRPDLPCPGATPTEGCTSGSEHPAASGMPSSWPSSSAISPLRVVFPSGVVAVHRGDADQVEMVRREQYRHEVVVAGIAVDDGHLSAPPGGAELAGRDPGHPRHDRRLVRPSRQRRYGDGSTIARADAGPRCSSSQPSRPALARAAVGHGPTRIPRHLSLAGGMATSGADRPAGCGTCSGHRATPPSSTRPMPPASGRTASRCSRARPPTERTPIHPDPDARGVVAGLITRSVGARSWRPLSGGPGGDGVRRPPQHRGDDRGRGPSTASSRSAAASRVDSGPRSCRRRHGADAGHSEPDRGCKPGGRVPRGGGDRGRRRRCRADHPLPASSRPEPPIAVARRPSSPPPDDECACLSSRTARDLRRAGGRYLGDRRSATRQTSPTRRTATRPRSACRVDCYPGDPG